MVLTVTRLKLYFLEDNTDAEIQQLKGAMKNNKDKNMHVRYLVIYNHLKGFQNIEISKMVGLCQHTVGTYIRKYKAQGLAGLVPAPKPGAPRQLTKEQEQILLETISTKTPDELGFQYKKNWNAILVMQWVNKHFHVQYSHSGMLVVLHRLNMSFTRPTYTLANADPVKQEEFRLKFESLKKLNRRKNSPYSF